MPVLEVFYVLSFVAMGGGGFVSVRAACPPHRNELWNALGAIVAIAGMHGFLIVFAFMLAQAKGG